MKKFLLAGTAALTLLSAFPIMAKNGPDVRANIHADVKADIWTNIAVDTACMQSAVKQRDGAFIDAFNAYNKSITDGLKVKMDAQVNAWAKVNVQERTLAINASEKVFASTYNSASLQLIKAKNTARQAYTKAALNCMKRQSSSSSSNSSLSSSVVSSVSSTSSASSAVACSALSGKLSGAFTLTSPINDEGRKLSLTGTGTMNNGSVQMSGSIQGLGFVAVGRAAGDITITQGTQGTLVLHLEGPVQTGFSSLPKTYNYSVTSATGVFANIQKSGKTELQLKGETNGSFRLELSGKCDR